MSKPLPDLLPPVRRDGPSPSVEPSRTDTDVARPRLLRDLTRSPAAPAEGRPPGERRAINWRSVGVGTLIAALISAVTPYNDLIIGNAPLTGSFFPPAITLSILFLVAANTLLRRFAPKHAFTGSELAVVLAMLLPACAVPANGLMKYLVPLPVTFFHQGQTDETFKNLFVSMGLPQWLFAADIKTGGMSRVVSEFFGRTPQGGSIPWAAWIVPLSAWGAFVACLYAAMLSLAPILREQWAVTERLAFPLAEVGSMLIEPPAGGRLVNRLLASRGFWVTAGIVFLLHAIAALHGYFPVGFPDLSLRFDLNGTFTEPPWSTLSPFVKRSTIYFTFVGIAYFVPSRVSFSLWSIFLIEQLTAMMIRNTGGDVPNGIWNDQHLGACVAMLLSILWIGRRHWAAVARDALRIKAGARATGASGGWARAFVIATLGMWVWLCAVGVGPVAAVVIVVTIVSVHILVARVVTETGLPFVRIMPTVPQMAANFPPSLMTGRDVFFAGTSTLFGAMATRESVLPHTLHALHIGRAGDGDAPSTRGLLAIAGWALTVAMAVSAVSMLWCQYHYAFPLNDPTAAMENANGSIDVPRDYIAANVVEHAAGRYTAKTYSSALHISIGAGIVLVLQACALLFAGWPLVPVGYLISHTWYAQMAWWSIFLGWLCKTVILRFGGSKAYQSLKPAFVGLVVGEAVATGFWLLVALVLVWMKQPYTVVNFLPS